MLSNSIFLAAARSSIPTRIPTSSLTPGAGEVSMGVEASVGNGHPQALGGTLTAFLGVLGEKTVAERPGEVAGSALTLHQLRVHHVFFPLSAVQSSITL